MSQLIESIKLLDGKFYNLFYHEQRMLTSLKTLCQMKTAFDLGKYLEGKEYPTKGLYKCRIVYDDISKETTFIPYERKVINHLKIVEDDAISYEFKYVDRKAINRLFDRRGECDDVLIVKGGMVTDCSFSNIAFRRGGSWYTPASALLKGTMRQHLIEESLIEVEEIKKSDIRSFDSFKLMNAMLEFDSPGVAVSNIVF